jgi:cytochrome b
MPADHAGNTETGHRAPAQSHNAKNGAADWLVWGFVGARHARFADFIHSPGAILAYVRGLLGGKAPRVFGHSPLAGVMVLALMTALSATGASGWLMITDAYRSVRYLEEVHEAPTALMLSLAVVHVVAVFVMSVWHGETLVRAMVTGCKRRH